MVPIDEPDRISTSLRIARRVALALILLALVAFAIFTFIYNQSLSLKPQLPALAATSTIATTTPLVATSSSPGAVVFSLHPATITLSTGKAITLNVAENYAVNVAADGFKSARFMAWSPDHRLFLGEMDGAGDTQTGRVLVLDGFDNQTGVFQGVHTYLDNLRNPNSVAFYTDPQGKEWIYVAMTDKLVRYPYQNGDDAPSGEPQTIATFPDFGPPVSDGGWHLTRTLVFDGGTLYVSVGSGCNSCEEPGIVRADIIAMNPDGSATSTVASGLRNAVGLTMAHGSLFATANEADHLGNDRPNDLVYKIFDGANYGWPYCYEYEGAIYPDATTQWQKPVDCAQVPLAYAELEPHSAPLGIAFFDEMFADPSLQNSFLVAEHGSGKKAIGTGYLVSRVVQGAWTPFISGFLASSTRQARPVDILQNDDHSFFLSDDFNGALYFIRYSH